MRVLFLDEETVTTCTTTAPEVAATVDEEVFVEPALVVVLVAVFPALVVTVVVLFSELEESSERGSLSVGFGERMLYRRATY